MPAELSLYSLNFIDRIIIVRFAGLAEAGLYALAIKFAQAINVLVRGFQLAWPPLAYSIEDDDEARRAYSLIVTWFIAVCAFVVVGMWLLARWIVRLLAAPEFFESYEAIGLLTTGMTLYALYLVLVVDPRPHRAHRIQLPRDGRRDRGQHRPQPRPRPAATGSSAPRIALVASYLVVLVLMYVFTQRLFPVPYEWGRLALIVGAAARPDRGRRPAAADRGRRRVPRPRSAVWLAFPAVLWVAGFLTRRGARGDRAPDVAGRRGGAPARRCASRRSGPTPEGPVRKEGRGPRLTREVYEAEARDEDRGSGV